MKKKTAKHYYVINIKEDLVYLLIIRRMPVSISIKPVACNRKTDTRLFKLQVGKNAANLYVPKAQQNKPNKI